MAAEELVSRLARIVGALRAGDPATAESAMAAIAFAPAQTEQRRSVSVGQQAAVFRRDSFVCRYCAQRTVPAPVLRTLSALYPRQFPYHQNWRSDAAHRAYWTITSSCDHLVAGTLGGDWRDPENLVTACWACNQRKANLSLDQLGWTLRPIPESGWDGLTGAYRALWELAGCPHKSYHQPWLAALSGSAAGSA